MREISTRELCAILNDLESQAAVHMTPEAYAGAVILAEQVRAHLGEHVRDAGRVLLAGQVGLCEASRVSLERGGR